MTPVDVLEAPVQEQTEKPVVVKPQLQFNPSLEACFNAIEDHMASHKTEETEKQLDLFLESHGFTREEVNRAYARTVNYDGAYVQACKDANKVDGYGLL